MDVSRRQATVAWLSVISNSVLTVGKLIVGLLIGSVGVISEAIHSGVDLVAAAIALFAVRTAHKPADEEHPFGHGKIENVSGTIEALLIFGAAIWIIVEAIQKLCRPHDLEAAGWGAAIMLVSAVANQVVSTVLFRVGRETDSVALQADAWHLRTDVWTSAGVMVALSIVSLGHRLHPDLDLNWIDPVAGLLVAMLILRAAWHLTVEAGRGLLDTALDREEREWLADFLGSQAVGSIRGWHRLRTRKAGAHRFVQFHLVVDKDMPVGAAHTLSDALVDAIRGRLPHTQVLIHVEPDDHVSGEVLERMANAAAPAEPRA